MSDTILITPLHDQHLALGAQMAPFAGYDMPIVYTDIAEEHRAVRTRAGMFDVSHMGEVWVEGPDAEAYVNRVFTNDVTLLKEGDVAYGMMTREDGGCVDDLLVYKFRRDAYLLVINASNIAKDYAWLQEQRGDHPALEVKNVSDETGQIAVQGPEAEARVCELFKADAEAIRALTFYTFKVIEFNGKKLLVSRTGYTGEDGFEIYCPADMTADLWSRLLGYGTVPCGLGCRDTLRFEAGLPLYGHELSDEISPVKGALSMFCKFDKEGGFIGCEELRRQKAEGTDKKICGLEIHDRAIARGGSEVIDPETGNVIGEVTTGYRGISVDKSLAVAYIDSRFAKKGTELRVRVRRKEFPATVVPRRFYSTSYKK